MSRSSIDWNCFLYSILMQGWKISFDMLINTILVSILYEMSRKFFYISRISIAKNNNLTNQERKILIIIYEIRTHFTCTSLWDLKIKFFHLILFIWPKEYFKFHNTELIPEICANKSFCLKKGQENGF